MAMEEGTTYREHSRRNGWSLPPHPFQGFAWVIILYFVIIYFSTLVPALPVEWQPAGYIINGLVCLVHVFSHIVATSINPADEAVRKANFGSTMPAFDRKKRRHVIENQHCYLCRVNVGAKSKHCSACNKCVSDFDHHCRWLNSCVGGENYRWFLAALVSACLSCVLTLLVCLVQFIGYYVDKDDGDLLQPFRGNSSHKGFGEFQVVHQTVSDQGWLAVIGVTGLLSLIAVVMLIHLFIFHVYLMCKGLSTYDYIVMQREELKDVEEYREYTASKLSLHGQGLTNARASKKGNRVTPTKPKSVAAGNKDTVDGDLHGADNRTMLYDKAYRHRNNDRMDEGETPPPTSSPIHKLEDHRVRINSGSAEDITPVKKMKKKKKKQKQQKPIISTVDNPKLYGTSNTGVSDYQSDSAESLEEVPRRPGDTESYDSAVMMTYDKHSSQASLVSGSPRRKSAQTKRKTKVIGSPMDPDDENDTLNSTTMFTINENAKFQEDGSLDYSNGYSSLPLTPVMLRKKNPTEVPPLDLAVLRSSTDSSVSFPPYTGTVRSTDTYGFTDRPIAVLRSVPEGGLESAL